MSDKQKGPTPNRRYQHVYVVVRIDLEDRSEDAPLADRVALTKAFLDHDQAEEECNRLNRVNRGKGCEYHTLIARLDAPAVLAATPGAERIRPEPLPIAETRRHVRDDKSRPKRQSDSAKT